MAGECDVSRIRKIKRAGRCFKHNQEVMASSGYDRCPSIRETLCFVLFSLCGTRERNSGGR